MRSNRIGPIPFLRNREHSRSRTSPLRHRIPADGRSISPPIRRATVEHAIGGLGGGNENRESMPVPAPATYGVRTIPPSQE
ncbi:MAG TPA: hypothetical protein ENN85_05350 [Methanoculleus sp.]|nr:hypothetical protein [Methanoculleus sp.]